MVKREQHRGADRLELEVSVPLTRVAVVEADVPEREEGQEDGESDAAEDRECAQPQPSLDREQRDRQQRDRIRLDQRGDREQRERGERAVRQQQEEDADAEGGGPHVEATERERAE